MSFHVVTALATVGFSTAAEYVLALEADLDSAILDGSLTDSFAAACSGCGIEALSLTMEVIIMALRLQ